MSESLEGRIRRLEDRAEIGDLITNYAVAVDDRDFETLGEMFSRDAVFDNVRGVEHGRERVMAYYRARLGEFGPTFHVPHSHSIRFDTKDSAHGVVLAHAELAIGRDTCVIALRYQDHYLREDGRWRFRQRAVRQLYAMPLAELPTGLALDLRKRWPGTDPAAADLPPDGALDGS